MGAGRTTDRHGRASRSSAARAAAALPLSFTRVWSAVVKRRCHRRRRRHRRCPSRLEVTASRRDREYAAVRLQLTNRRR